MIFSGFIASGPYRFSSPRSNGHLCSVLASLSNIDGYSVYRQRVGLVGEGCIFAISLDHCIFSFGLPACLSDQHYVVASPAYYKNILAVATQDLGNPLEGFFYYR